MKELLKKVAVGESKVLRVAHPKVSAIAHVVDVEDGASVLVASVAAIVRSHDQRHEAHHPVVDQEDALIAKHAAVAVDAEGCLESRPGEHGEPHQVVIVPIHAMPLVAPILHKHVVHPESLPPRLRRRRRRLPPLPPVLDAVLLARHPKLLDATRVLRPLIPPVEGGHRHDAVPHPGERDPELVADVGEAPRLGEGGDLGRDNDNVHALSHRQDVRVLLHNLRVLGQGGGDLLGESLGGGGGGDLLDGNVLNRYDSVRGFRLLHR
mmetsp:Transcript_42662/g.106777  ORF Transcript_42662/g.106777 Transcript_42662/m.106777 type:complete len:265 (-) Transcript_42662:456-1250(-)